MADNADIFAEAERRHKRLFEQLAAASVSDLKAVVGPNGPGAGRSRGEDLWTMSFTVEAWRVDGGEIQQRGREIRAGFQGGDGVFVLAVVPIDNALSG